MVTVMLLRVAMVLALGLLLLAPAEAVLRPPVTTWEQTPVFCTRALQRLFFSIPPPPAAAVCPYPALSPRRPDDRLRSLRTAPGHSSNTSGPLSAEAISFIKRHNFSLITLEKNTMINLPPVADDAEKKIVQQARCACLCACACCLLPVRRQRQAS